MDLILGTHPAWQQFSLKHVTLWSIINKLIWKFSNFRASKVQLIELIHELKFLKKWNINILPQNRSCLSLIISEWNSQILFTVRSYIFNTYVEATRQEKKNKGGIQKFRCDQKAHFRPIMYLTGNIFIIIKVPLC